MAEHQYVHSYFCTETGVRIAAPGVCKAVDPVNGHDELAPEAPVASGGPLELVKEAVEEANRHWSKELDELLEGLKVDHIAQLEMLDKDCTSRLDKQAAAHGAEIEKIKSAHAAEIEQLRAELAAAKASAAAPPSPVEASTEIAAPVASKKNPKT